MPELTVGLYIYCSCGAHLCNQSEYDAQRSERFHGTPCIVVQPCENCLKQARDEGYNEGYAVGQQEVERKSLRKKVYKHDNRS